MTSLSSDHLYRTSDLLLYDPRLLLPTPRAVPDPSPLYTGLFIIISPLLRPSLSSFYYSIAIDLSYRLLRSALACPDYRLNE